MDAKESLYYGLGELAYAVAGSDGQVQREEREEVHKVILQKAEQNDLEYQISEIIFQILDKENFDLEAAYDNAIKQIKLGSHHLTGKMKEDFIAFVEDVAKAYPPYTDEEKKYVDRFRKDLKEL